jgi:sarcosine oxidase, subunit alpha
MSIPKENARVLETASQNLDPNASVPVARSPLAPAGAREVIDGWEYSDGASSGPVLVSDRSALAKVHLRVDASPEVITTLGTRFGRAAWVGDRLVVGSGPDEWLVLGAPGQAATVAEEYTRDLRAAQPGRVTVIDVTHGRALMRVSGPQTLALLRRVTAVDLDDRLVPDGSALRTSVARVVTDVVRDDHDGFASYLLHCERSSGLYLQQSLLAAGADLGAVAGASRPAWPDHPGG